MSTPSATAASIAFARSDVLQDARVSPGRSQQALYTASRAFGATPSTLPRKVPNIDALTKFPAAVVAVCVPWPSTSRGDSISPSSRLPVAWVRAPTSRQEPCRRLPPRARNIQFRQRTRKHRPSWVLHRGIRHPLRLRACGTATRLPDRARRERTGNTPRIFSAKRPHAKRAPNGGSGTSVKNGRKFLSIYSML